LNLIVQARVTIVTSERFHLKRFNYLPPCAMPLLAQLSSLYDNLIARAQEPAHDGSRQLFIAGHRCGWICVPAIDALSKVPSVITTAQSVHFGPELMPGPALDALLASLANLLRAAGCAPGWRNELLDVRDENGTAIGAIERGVMRPLGLITRAVHLSGWSADSKIWVARRALSKATDPGMWDTLVGGLVGYQEDDDRAIVREADEEAGLDEPQILQRTPLRTITTMRRRVPEGYQIEGVLTCECLLPADVVPQNRDGEVMDIACLEPSKVISMVQAGEFTLEASIVLVEDLLRRAAS
jgi:isopentenyldiphosphate isomerase